METEPIYETISSFRMTTDSDSPSLQILTPPVTSQTIANPFEEFQEQKKEFQRIFEEH